MSHFQKTKHSSSRLKNTLLFLLLFILSQSGFSQIEKCCLIGGNFTLTYGNGVELDPLCEGGLLIEGTVKINSQINCPVTGRVTIEFLVGAFGTIAFSQEDLTNDLIPEPVDIPSN